MTEEESIPRSYAVEKTVPERCVVEEEFSKKRSMEKRSVTYLSSLDIPLKRHGMTKEESE